MKWTGMGTSVEVIEGKEGKEGAFHMYKYVPLYNNVQIRGTNLGEINQVNSGPSTDVAS